MIFCPEGIAVYIDEDLKRIAAEGPQKNLSLESVTENPSIGVAREGDVRLRFRELSYGPAGAYRYGDATFGMCWTC